MPLPTAKTPPRMGVGTVRMLIYGPTKVGKTTFAAQAPECLILATEPGCDALDTYQMPIGTWAEFLSACKDVAAGKHAFRTVAVDTIDNLYGYCQAHVCAELGIAHPADAGYGKGFSAVANEWKRVLLRLAQLPYGLIMIGHSRERDVESKAGSFTRIQPALTESARLATLALVDLCLYAEIDTVRQADGTLTYKRVLRTKPSPLYDAGDRTGRLPDPLPLDYAAFAAALTEATKTTKEKK